MIVKRGQTLSVYLAPNSSEVERQAVNDFCKILNTAVGVIAVEKHEKPTDNKEKRVVMRLDANLNYGEGFEIKKENGYIVVIYQTPNGGFYGLHYLIESSLDVVYARGAVELECDYLTANRVKFKPTKKVIKPAFRERAVNACGIGSTGLDHIDDGSARYYAVNGLNATSHAYISEWEKYPLYCAGLNDSATRIEDLINTNPEYFMTDSDGEPKKAKHDSYVNFYNLDVAKVIANRLYEKSKDKSDRIKMQFIMPDDPYFFVKINGVELSAMPFTTSDGVTVYPDQKNYKSTVYFNFLNAVAREYNKLKPNSDLYTLAYLYAEQAPEVEIDEHLVVHLAPISTNEKHSYIASGETGNKEIRENIERWATKCKRLGIYTYWFSFKGGIYSRPIIKTLQENLKWFKSLGVSGVLMESKLDCSFSENLSAPQKDGIKWFDMNEAYLWMANKLLFNPDLNADGLLKRFCKVVYKESYKEMLAYYKLIEKGYKKVDEYVWYATGGDVYIRKFILQAGVDKAVLATLKSACDKANTSTVKRRVESVYQTVKKEIEKFSSYIEEDFVITYTDFGQDNILQTEQIDYISNPNSVWNKAMPVRVVRNYNTYEFYDKSSNFNCRALYDDENLYISYTVYDDQIEKFEIKPDGQTVVYRTDGKTLVSYAETYIGGNALNQSEYYGLISGFNGKAETIQFYKHVGSPISKPIPSGAKDVKFVHLSERLEQRYYIHVQVLPLNALGVKVEDFKPYGSFVYYTDRYKRAGWKGNGLWNKDNIYKLKR